MQSYFSLLGRHGVLEVKITNEIVERSVSNLTPDDRKSARIPLQHYGFLGSRILRLSLSIV